MQIESKLDNVESNVDKNDNKKTHIKDTDTDKGELDL